MNKEFLKELPNLVFYNFALFCTQALGGRVMRVMTSFTRLQYDNAVLQCEHGLLSKPDLGNWHTSFWSVEDVLLLGTLFVLLAVLSCTRTQNLLNQCSVLSSSVLCLKIKQITFRKICLKIKQSALFYWTKILVLNVCCDSEFHNPILLHVESFFLSFGNTHFHCIEYTSNRFIWITRIWEKIYSASKRVCL